MQVGSNAHFAAQIVITILWSLLALYALRTPEDMKGRDDPSSLWKIGIPLLAMVGVCATPAVLAVVSCILFVLAAAFSYFEERNAFEEIENIDSSAFDSFALYCGCAVLGFIMFPRMILEAVMLLF